MIEKINYEKTVAGKVIERLRDDIVNGRFPEGSHITIKQIADVYGVSYMPVREAFRALEGERLIEIVPYRGVTVRSVDESFIRNMFGVLHALEVFMTEEAAHNMGDNEIRILREINAQVALLKDTDEDKARYLDLNTSFHTHIFQWAGNSIAQSLHMYYHSLMRTLRSRYPHPYSRIQECHEQHEAIITALQTKNEFLIKSAADRHVIDAMNCFMEQYRREKTPSPR